MEALAVVGVDVNGESNTEEASVEKSSPSSASSPQKQIADSIVYQLVRVEGDGTLVPATDDEVMEVENMLEDENNVLPSTESLGCPQDHVSYEVLSPKKSNTEGSEGLLNCDNSEVSSRNLNSSLEEKKLQLSCEAPNPKCINRDGQYSDQPHCSPVCNMFRPENSSQETATLSSQRLDDGHGSQLGNAETCLESTKNEPSAGKSSVNDVRSSSMPKFSFLKGEICLDNLTIRELQETFRATFGRQTSVKDKVWLRRRIAMGLTNSCDVPSAGLIIKDKMIVQKKLKEAQCEAESSKCESGSQLVDQITGTVTDNSQNSPSKPTSHLEDQRFLSSKRPRTSTLESESNSEYLQMEEIGAKRFRKPTRRYIEELSEVETRECSGRFITSVKSPGHSQSLRKSRVGATQGAGSQGTTFVTRQDSLGGCGVQIPYVSRVRRGRPRTNFMALLNVAVIQREKPVIQSSDERDLDLQKVDSSSDNSDDNVDSVPAAKSATRRKHHRAWTLSEVMKLVEGVSKYGAGRWSEIKRVAFSSYTYRTSVDLKDKWRNLLRASFAKGPLEKGAQSSRKTNTSIPIPAPILVRVRELAEMQTQVGIEFGPSKFAGDGGGIVQERGSSGFL